MKFTIDLAKLSIMQRYEVKELLIRFFNESARSINSDLQESYGSEEAKNSEAYRNLVGWMTAAKEQAESVRSQDIDNNSVAVGKLVKVVGKPSGRMMLNPGTAHQYGYIGNVTDQEGLLFKVNGVWYDHSSLTCNY